MSTVMATPDWECHFVQSLMGTWFGFAGQFPIIRTPTPRSQGKRLHTGHHTTELAARDELFALIALTK